MGSNASLLDTLKLNKFLLISWVIYAIAKMTVYIVALDSSRDYEFMTPAYVVTEGFVVITYEFFLAILFKLKRI